MDRSRPRAGRRQPPHPAQRPLPRSAAARAGPRSLTAATTLVIEEASEVTPELVDAFARLTPQLSRSSPPPGPAELDEIVRSPTTTLLVARHGEPSEIVGTLTLVVFRIPTGLRAWVEDVVVDDSVRGQGVGSALTREALRRADAAGARTVDLTSRPSREAANRLYRRLGFELRETNVYRHSTGG